MLETKIRVMITIAVQNEDKTAKDILRLALGELQNAKEGITEEQKENIIRKIVKSNDTTLSLLQHESEQKDMLIKENEILRSLVPKEMTKEDILSFINDNDINMVEDNIGKSIGVVMGAMKKNKFVANGKIVKEVVSDLVGGISG